MSYPFHLVALISTYQEGTLANAAVQSCLTAGLEVVVWEGPAGEERCDEAPVTEILPTIDFRWHAAEWSTDAVKRTEMLNYAKQQWHTKPLWVLWLDGDEQLLNGRALWDMCQSIMWADEHTGASILKPDNPPTGGAPIRLVEPDGSTSLLKGRLVRGDLIRSYVVSNLVLEMVNGISLRLGNVQTRVEDQPHVQAAIHLGQLIQEASGSKKAELEEKLNDLFGLLYLSPPLPGEPVIVHRSHLRHPARQALRMHEQEADQLDILGLPTA